MYNKYGFKHESHPMESFSCKFCKKKIITRHPTKRFCSDSCRVKNWVKYNKDKIAIIQKRCRRNQKADLGVEE